MELTSAGDSLHFVCVGDAPQDPEYTRRLQDRLPVDVRERSTFIPAVPYDEMPLYYSLAGATGGCLVSTSRFESVPMVFLEAMACGCPVISSNVGGVGEILEDHVTAELFDVDDHAAAINAAQRLIGEDAREHRSRVVERARTYVLKHHSLDTVAETFSAVLDSVVPRR